GPEAVPGTAVEARDHAAPPFRGTVPWHTLPDGEAMIRTVSREVDDPRRRAPPAPARPSNAS
ncbi:hypothetical protein, partial [Streptomyces sp. NPDC057094]|uniref:hypothetical protein n=1 Tax=Streptomyces sp. NPDC057094 TaxID=3346018 RepID=UPI00363E87FA